MLQGITVLDFTQYLPGPYATLRLADMGATVIKIESPKGDPARNMTGGLVFRANNRNKKSIMLDLKNPQQKNTIFQLIEGADVIIEGFRPGVMEKLQLNFDEVKKINPKIIYCSLSGYGQVGFLRSFGSHDVNYLAMSGVLSQFKDNEGKPVLPTITIADLAGGLAASESILAALYQREKSGKGKYIDLSITETMFSFMATHALFYQKEGRRHGSPMIDGKVVCYHLYETLDHRFISLAALEEKFWESFCFAIQREDLIQHQFSPTNKENKVYIELVNIFLSKPFSEWCEFSKRIDCCMAPVFEIDEVLQQDWVIEGERAVLSKWGDIQIKTTPQTEKMGPPPSLNEHGNDLVEERGRLT